MYKENMGKYEIEMVDGKIETFTGWAEKYEGDFTIYDENNRILAHYVQGCFRSVRLIK